MGMYVMCTLSGPSECSKWFVPASIQTHIDAVIRSSTYGTAVNGTGSSWVTLRSNRAKQTGK